MRADVAAYAQPTPRRLYVHDDLSDDVARRYGAGSPAALLARDLLAAVAREAERVRLLTLGEQVERVVAQGAHAPFAIAIGVGSAGRRVAETLHERAGWFPRIRRVGLTREEDGRGGYHLISTETAELAAQLARIDPLADGASLAVVDDTVFSGLTMRSVLEALPAATRARTRAFCLRGVAESIAAVAALDHRRRRGARQAPRGRELHQRQRPGAPHRDTPARAATTGLLRAPRMDPRVVPRRPRGSADPVPPAERAAGATPSPQLGARLSARKGSTSERCSARARCCTVLTAMSTASRPLAVQLGEFVAGLRFENLPPAVVDKAKAVVNHAVTVGMAGFGTERAGAARQAVLSQERLGTRPVGAGQGATLWVEGTRVTRVGAGFANGVAVAVNNQCDSYHMAWPPPKAKAAPGGSC